LLPCVAVTLLFSGVVEETSSCCLKGQQMAPSLMGNVWPDVACQSMAMLLFASGEMVSRHVANTAQLDVLMAPQWGMSCVMAHSAMLTGARSVREGTGAERGLGLSMLRLPICWGPCMIGCILDVAGFLLGSSGGLLGLHFASTSMWG
jgi:hypothetical protein